MKKKINRLVCCLAVAAVMVGCGQAGQPAKPSESKTAAAVTEADTAKTEAADTQAAETTESNYPSRPMTAMVGWKVGGGQDLMVRAVAAHIKDYANGQPMIVTNVDGGASVQGVVEYMGYEEDGYNLLSWATAQTIKTHMQQTDYSIEDFQPIGNMVSGNPYILVRSDSQFKTVNDLVAYAKENPGKLTIGNSGAGGGNHLAALQFCIATGIEANHIGYEGGSASAQATLGGEVDCSMNVPAEGIASVEAGDLMMLCLLAEERSEFFPDVPTAKENGFDVINEQNRGFMIHKSVPMETVNALESMLKQVAENEAFIQQAKELNMEVKWMGIEEYTQSLKEEDELYQEIIQSNELGDKY